MGHFKPLWVDVDGDDFSGTGDTSTLDDVEPDAAGSENHGAATWRELGRVDHGAVSCHHAAADDAGGGERDIDGHRDDGLLANHGVAAEGSDVEGSGDGVAVPSGGTLVGQSVIRVFAGDLLLEVCDNGPGVELVDGEIPGATGVGLRNTRERLLELYGPHHSFRLSEAEPQGLAIRIRIPFETQQT